MRRIISLLICLGVLTVAANADHITVSGNVSGVWEADTVFVAGDVTVPAGQALTIQPGVKVLFRGHYRFSVLDNANLQAVGTEQDSIWFTAPDTTQGWFGLRFQSASALCRLRYCSITYGKATYSTLTNGSGGGIYCSDSDIQIERCRIAHCIAVGGTGTAGGGGIFCGNGSNPLILENAIEYNFAGNSGSNSAGGGICIVSCTPAVIGNIIRGNRTDSAGGGIWCSGLSDPEIAHNLIENNQAGYQQQYFTMPGSGAGVACSSTNAMIRYNLIRSNITLYGENSGGGISMGGGAPKIYSNRIQDNTAKKGGGISAGNISNYQIVSNIIENNHASSSGSGGGFDLQNGSGMVIANLFINNECTASGIGGAASCRYSSVLFQDNIFSSNEAESGAGLNSWDSNPTLRDNTFISNHAASGGGTHLHFGSNMGAPKLEGNLYIANSATAYGGALSMTVIVDSLHRNTLVGNEASAQGGALYLGSGCDLALWSTIITANGPAPICNYGPASTVNIAFSDIQPEWPGLGNISTYPAFVDTARDDYRLLWGSPCIDAGHPDSLDPDGTRTDVGAFYFDQSVPMRVLLTPHEIPYLIPETGGAMTYTARVDNWSEQERTATLWCDVTLPDSSTFGPMLGPLTVTVPAHTMLARERVQAIPAAAPLGVYRYNAYAVVEGDTSKDSFLFGKLGPVAAGADIAAGDWSNRGDPFAGPVAMESYPGMPRNCALHSCHPNPFNPETVARFELRDASHVSLRVYDTAGREVATLVDGWRNTGAHEATFDGSGLPSGVYLVRLEAGEGTAVQKVVLLK
ncbi:MAG: T9SS C-terminal target domain-containing protein [Candidatus Zixiibacteriota bacterium]|nr:MAG: T9SS C-terminal target domain-containing protein [candidate division Zixibacteria bacterium]